MAPSSPISGSEPAGSTALVAQVRECFGRAAYTHKTHEKQADLYFRRHEVLKRVQIALSTLTTTGIIATIFGAGRLPAAAIAAVLSAALTAVMAYTKDRDLAALAQQHAATASRLWVIRESYLSLLSDLAAGQTELAIAREWRDALQTDLAAIYANAPAGPTGWCTQGLDGLTKTKATSSNSRFTYPVYSPTASRIFHSVSSSPIPIFGR